MNLPEKRVLELAKAGKISAEEAEELIGAISKSPPGWRTVLNPFQRLGTGTGVALTGLLMGASVAVSLMGIRFDGAIDVHVRGKPSLFAALFDAGNATLVMSVVLWAASAAFIKRGRWVDFFISVGIARAPLVLLGAFLALLAPSPNDLAHRVMTNPMDPMLLLLAVLTIPFTVWFFTWLYQGFKTSSGLAGARAVGLFIAGVVIAEICSRLLLSAATL